MFIYTQIHKYLIKRYIFVTFICNKRYCVSKVQVEYIYIYKSFLIKIQNLIFVFIRKFLRENKNSFVCLCKEEVRDILDFLGFVIFRYIIEGSKINKWKVTFIPRDAKYTSVSISFWNFNVCYPYFSTLSPTMCFPHQNSSYTLFNIFFF